MRLTCAAFASRQVANELSTSIKDGVKSLGLHHGRYKLAVHVTLGQRGGQAMRLASRCLWDTTTDKCVRGCGAMTDEHACMIAVH